MATGGLINRYFCNECGKYLNDDLVENHLNNNPDHSVSLRLTNITNYESEIIVPTSTEYGFVDEVGGANTISISGTDFYLTPSGSDPIEFSKQEDLINASGTLQSDLDTKVALSGGKMVGTLELYQDPTQNLDAVTLQYLNDLNATTSGALMGEIAATSGSLESIIQTVDSKRAVNYVFTSGLSGEVLPYASVKSVGFSVMGQIVFPGTDFLAVPSLSQVIMSAQAGTTGYMRLYDVTNATEIATASSSSTVMNIINMSVVGSWPAGEAILEIQGRNSTNNRWCRLSTLSMRWN